jgi:hypothetical protein
LTPPVTAPAVPAIAPAARPRHCGRKPLLSGNTPMWHNLRIYSDTTNNNKNPERTMANSKSNAAKINKLMAEGFALYTTITAACMSGHIPESQIPNIKKLKSLKRRIERLEGAA